MITGPLLPLFSYGTLQQPEVQIATFGRALAGTPAALPGYRLGRLAISDPEVARVSGLAWHLVAEPTGDPADEVAGIAFVLTEAELAMADAYEAADYRRVTVRLASGAEAHLYVRA